MAFVCTVKGAHGMRYLYATDCRCTGASPHCAGRHGTQWGAFTAESPQRRWLKRRRCA